MVRMCITLLETGKQFQSSCNILLYVIKPRLSLLWTGNDMSSSVIVRRKSGTCMQSGLAVIIVICISSPVGEICTSGGEKEGQGRVPQSGYCRHSMSAPNRRWVTVEVSFLTISSAGSLLPAARWGNSNNRDYLHTLQAREGRRQTAPTKHPCHHLGQEGAL